MAYLIFIAYQYVRFSMLPTGKRRVLRACVRACLSECQCQVVYCHFSGQTILYSDIVSSIFGVKVSLLYDIMVKPDSSRPWWLFFFNILT